MQLQVIGPERDHRCEGGARAHEGEVGARQLERGASSLPRLGRGAEPLEEIGGRPEVPGPRALAHGDVDAGVAEDRSGERGGRGLAGGARDADARPCPALEQQVAEARDARAPSAELSRPEARPRASRRRGRRSRRRRGRHRGRRRAGRRSRAHAARAPRRARAPGSRAAPRFPRRRAAARARPRRRRTPRSGHPHPDHRGSTSFSRTKARMTSSRSVAPVELQQVVEGLAGEVTTRRGSEPCRRCGSCSTPSPPLARRSRASPRS